MGCACVAYKRKHSSTLDERKKEDDLWVGGERGEMSDE